MADPRTLAAIAGMSLVTYATKAGGLAAVARVDLPDRAETALEALPGAIVVAVLVPELLRGGPPEWGGAVVVVVVARRTDRTVPALVAGLVALTLLRGLLPAG